MSKKEYDTDNMNIVEWIKTFRVRHSWISILPLFLCFGAWLLPELIGMDLSEALVPAMAGALLAGVPAWASIGIFQVGLEFIRVIRIDRDRREVVATLPKEARARVNTHDRLRYISYDNILVKLYDRSNWKGELRIPDGIEYIGEHAFDWLVAPTTNCRPARFKSFVKFLLIPDSIKEVKPYNIPIETKIVFDDATQKILCHKIKAQLADRHIKIKGGLFSDMLDECTSAKNSHKVFERTYVPSKVLEGIENAFAKLDDPLIKIYLMDKIHEQILKGNISFNGFRAILSRSSMEDEYKARYKSSGVINRIYGSRQNATDKYAYAYYETENILNIQNDRKWAKAHPNELKTTYKRLDDLVKFIEDVADNPDQFRQSHLEELNRLALELYPGSGNLPEKE